MSRARTVSLAPFPDGIFSSKQSLLQDVSHLALTGGVSLTGGKLVHAAGTNGFATATGLSLSGNVWAAYRVEPGATAGQVQSQYQSASANGHSSRFSTIHVAALTTGGSTTARLFWNSACDAVVSGFQLVDMDEVLAQPCDIYLAAGQSLIASESSSPEIDGALDVWKQRCLYMPNVTNATFGAVAGSIRACVPPLQMTAASTGVSPAHAFANEIERSTAAGRNVLIIAAASGGTRLTGAGAEWAVGGARYNEAVSRAVGVRETNFDNSIRGILWAQGESDRSGTMDATYPAAFASMVAGFRSEFGEATLPVIILGPMPDDLNANQALFIQTQERLDQDSGHATAVSGVHYVARGAGFMSGDGTHPTAAGQRVIGKAAAAVAKANGLPLAP